MLNNIFLTDEQNELYELAMKFARNEMMPKSAEYDETSTFPRDIINKAWELGFLNSCIPAEFGGNGISHLDATLITEALAYGCMGMNTSMMANDLALLPIVIGGSKEQKEQFLRPFTESPLLASFCLTEPSNGSDAGGIRTTIVEKGNDVIINGNKMWITNAGHADLFVVFGTMDSKLKYKGITAVVVEKNTPGISIDKPEKKMGHRCSDTRAMSFKNVVVPKKNVLGGMGQGWKICMQTLDHSRPLIAASATGGSLSALDHCTKYAKERIQFDVPLANHQAIQLMISDMAIKVEASRNLVRNAAKLLDMNLSNTLYASMAKVFASDACMEIATNAVQIYGGYGYSKEYPVEKIMRDAKLLQIYEGTSQIQKFVVCREIMK